jgi:cob(I)alamin adenosyltransferase
MPKQARKTHSRPIGKESIGMSEQQGLVMINTGHGKGKTTAALGAVLRAVGQGFSALILQFIKSGDGYGELEGLSYLRGVEIRSLGLGLVDDEELGPHREAALKAWDMAKQEVLSSQWDLIVLDELCIAMKHGFVTVEDVAGLIHDKPKNLILIITGRYCPKELYDYADTVTEMKAIKHHMAAGHESQAGIEY